MNTTQNELAGPRTLENAQEWMRDRLAKRVHPLGLTDPSETATTIESLTGLDGGSWAPAWISAGKRFFAAGEKARDAGRFEDAREGFRQAYGFFFLGHFPCPNHPEKEESYRLELEAYRQLGLLCVPEIERHEIPFPGREGEGHRIKFYFRRPENIDRPPVVVMWGGVDAWKEEMTELSESLLSCGIATIALDNVGTGESPIKATADGERQFAPVFEWVENNAAVDGGRMAILGRSFGGHWATKLAHQTPDRFRAAVNWGGGVHYMFQRDWIAQSRYPDSYLMDLVETRSRMLGAANDDEYIAGFRQLSLLDQGLLDGPCAPMLLVNGKEDRQCPNTDIELLLDHGDPKAVRLFPGGHMGFGPHTVPTIVRWLERQLSDTGAWSRAANE